MRATAENFVKPWAYRLFFLRRLPLALAAGLEMESLTSSSCEVGITYGFRNTNPFGSMYFAAQAMASELSTGALGMMAREARTVDKPAMLVSAMSASFSKPARSRIVFRCDDGEAVNAAVEKALRDRSSERVLCKSVGTDSDGDIVSQFEYEWWFSARRKN